MILEITEAGDMKSIKFTVPGNPFGKQRPKIRQNGYIYKDLHAKKDNTA